MSYDSSTTKITNTANVATQNGNKGLQVVIGLGQSGVSAVHYLLSQGFEVAVTDGNPSPNLADKLPASVTIRKFGEIDSQLLLQASRIVISPGISLEQPAVAGAIKAGIAVVSDIQLFHEALTKRAQQTGKKVPIVAITGSNAKSTVTTLVGEMAKDAGVNVGVGGNIGVPALSLLDNADMELAVLELSSFQLETVTDLNAEVVTVLNMSPDHLDRHGDMLGYHEAKHRIFQGAKSFVTNRDDDLTIPVNGAIADGAMSVSIGGDAPAEGQYGLIVEEGQVYLAKGQTKLLNTNELKIKGQHNQMNALSALALGELAGLPLDSMLNTLKGFAGLPHRCQYIANINGVDYFNDSKGTNIGSTMAAIKGLGESYTAADKSAKLLLIVGGQGKGQDFSELTPWVNQYVSQLLFMGEDAQKIEAQLQAGGLNTAVECHQVATLEQAMAKTQSLTQSSLSLVKAVLLSPACASFDQFSGYVQRGDKFVELVHSLSINNK